MAKLSSEIFELINSQFPDTAEIVITANKQEIIKVKPLEVNKIADFLRHKEDLLFNCLILLTATDDANGKKFTEEDGSFHYEGGTFSVYYHLESSELKHKLTLKTSVERDFPSVESVYSIWKTADWQEREAYDMIGIKFLNHPELIRILMPYDWEDSYPLRKDYKNPEFYRGMKIGNG